jgi:ribonuclease-3
MKNLEENISYVFKNKNLLIEATTHSSYSNDSKNKKIKNYERLEFLGDSILSLIVSEHLFLNYKELPEGELTKIRASLVCEKSLFEFGQKIDLGRFLLLGKGEEMTGGRTRPSIIADVFEAVLAAIFLDGGIEPAKKFVISFIPPNIDSFTKKAFNDYKTILQEIIQQNKEEKVEYVLTLETGPDHDKSFFVEVHLNSNVIGKGKGRSKKLAEQNAAKEALVLMGYEPQ